MGLAKYDRVVNVNMKHAAMWVAVYDIMKWVRLAWWHMQWRIALGIVIIVVAFIADQVMK